MSAGDRTVTVTLRALVAGYVSDIGKASAATKTFAAGSKEAATAHAATWKTIGTGMLVAGAAIASGLIFAVKAFADFDAQLSQVKAVSGATAGQMKQLSDAALQAGADTVFSASGAAEAETELAKVGVSVSDILNGALTGALNLAAAGGLSLGDAATYAGQTMKIFKLEGKDVGHIADVLASGANKSAADVDSLAQALQQAGLQAANTGLTLEDTVGTLALFSDNALNGSDAGTSLKTMLQRLNPTTVEAKNKMKELGLDFFDAQGNFIGIEASAGLLQDRLKNLTVEQRNAALNVIFGSDSVRAATVLYNAGATGVAKYVDAVNDSGAAARVAAINMDNLNGDLEALRGSIETALIKAGSQGNDVLRITVQNITDVVNAFGSLPDGVQGAGIAIGAVLAAVLLLGGAFITIAPKIVAARAAMVELGITSTAVRGILMGPWGIAIAAGILGLGLFAKGQMDAKNRADELKATLDEQTGALTDNTRRKIAQRLQDEGALDAATKLGLSVKDVTTAVYEGGNAYASMNAKLQQLRLEQSHQQYGTEEYIATSDAIETVQTSIDGLVGDLGNATDAQKQVAAATGTTAAETGGLTEQQTQSADAAQAQADALDAAKEAIKGYGSAAADALTGVIDLKQAIADANNGLLDENKHLDKTKLGLDVNTQAGRDNTQALLQIAQAAKDSAVANFTNGQSVDQVTASMMGPGGSREAFVTTAIKMGATKDQANALADQLGLTTTNVGQLTTALNSVPKQTTLSITVLSTLAGQRIQAVRDALDALHDKTLTVTTITQEKNIAAHGGATGVNNAAGGLIVGPGTGTSDSIPARLSSGEYVVKAAAVARYGSAFFDTVNSMRFATGGIVTAPAAAPSSRTGALFAGDLVVQGAPGMDINALTVAVARRLAFAVI